MPDESETIKSFRAKFGDKAADEVKQRLTGAETKSMEIAKFCNSAWKDRSFAECQELLVGLVTAAVAFGKSIDCPGDVMVQMFLHYLQMAYKDDIKVMAVSERDNQPSHDESFGFRGDAVFDTGRPKSKRELN
ncbi:MAG TPA: hypothetical protein VIY48_12280 [Candidatus Paceibacterota bacterium]